jgi:uncharacterized membrane protein
MAERLGYSLTAVVLALMLVGLTVNTFLPMMGFPRPLDPVPVVLVGDTLTASFYAIRRKYPAKYEWRLALEALEPTEIRLVAISGLCVALAVLGANRLNNGAGDQLSLVALCGIVLTLLFVLRWQRQVREGMTCVVFYLLSVALLLMTSLRGWYVTGHDIQTEYRVFQLTEAHARWDISYFRNAYNACLSITILPTEMSQVLHVDNPYIFKVFFQLMFGVCPVLVYAISRRYFSRFISALALIYFISFTTFFTDMPYLNRQEMAFLFVCVGILGITNFRWPRRQRRLILFAASLGVEFSHYSTMYLFLGTLLIVWLAHEVSALIRGKRHSRRSAHAIKAPWAGRAKTLGFSSILVVAAIAFAWGGLATQTAQGAFTDAKSSLLQLIHDHETQSNDVSYGIVPGKSASPQDVLNQYRRETLKLRGSASSSYLPISAAARYPTPAVSAPSLPLTSVGRFLSDMSVPVPTLNSMLRQATAKGEQVFVIIGLIAFLLVPRRRRQISPEFFWLCIGSTFIVGIVTLLPSLSVDYDVLRAFQEALIMIAPVLVVGSLTVFERLGTVWASRIAVTICLGVFISTTGLLPQVLGGYPAQLSLNNSGQYYDWYYTHPQEVAAVAWLGGKPGVLPDGLQASFDYARFAFTSKSDVTGQQVVGGIYPVSIQRDNWVLIGFSALQTGQDTIYYDGDTITYRYPFGFLQNNKNLVYNDGGTEIYR